MGLRKAEMTDMVPSGGGKTRITFLAPSRGLIGYYSIFMTDTRGTGIMNRLFHSYEPHKGPRITSYNVCYTKLLRLLAATKNQQFQETAV